MLAGKNILLGVTGGIAVYKAVDLASKLTARKANVKVIMTDGALEFVSPLTFRSITRQSVTTKMFDANAPIEHISLADWCDIAVIAPATANIIGKLAGGIADDLLTTAMMATTSPKVIVPAMNVHMWENEIVQDNIAKLERYGYMQVPPATGMLACGYEGKGRLPEPVEILSFIETYLQYGKDLKGRTVLITAGACREYLDPMRYFSNLSSGKMGLALAKAAYQRGAEVILIHSELHEQIPYYLENSHLAVTSEEMYRKVQQYAAQADVVIMNAAVTDYKPSATASSKLKKDGKTMMLELHPTTDILAEIYRTKKEQQLIVGFAAETDDLLPNAEKKLSKCDLIAVNNLAVAGQENTSLTLLGKVQGSTTGRKVLSFEGSKFAAAHQVLNGIQEYLKRPTQA